MGTLVIISAPSGGGKTVITQYLLQHIPHAARLVTSTTRPPRPGEVDGVDYHFLTKEKFAEKIAAGDFIEHVVYAENLYGTDRVELQNLLDNSVCVISNLDVRGQAELVAAGIPTISIFLLPESLEILKTRLARRSDASNEYLAERLHRAEIEIATAPQFDYQIVNREGRLDETIAQIRAILDKITPVG